MRFCGVLVLILCWGVSHAQYSNSWINFSQAYYKLKIAKDGIYRLGYQDLKDAGVPVDGIDPRLLQLYHRGKEQAILFQHNQRPADGVFQSGEYLEFFGQRNDGTLDASLYKESSLQPHPYYNLYSDTAAYFLTWNSQPVQGKRMEVVDLVNSTNLSKEPFQIGELLSVYTSEYSGGETTNGYATLSAFDRGEGWTGPVICTVNSGCTGQQDFSFTLTNVVSASISPTVEVQVAGRDHLQHAAEIYVGPNAGSLRLVSQANFQNFETPILSTSILASDIAADGKVTVRVKALGVGGIRDRMSVSYIKINYPKGFDLAGTTSARGNLVATIAGKSYLEFSNAANGTRVFDITDLENIRVVGTHQSGAALSAVVPSTTIARTLFTTSITFGKESIDLERASFRSILPATHNYLVISNRSLMQPSLGFPDAVKAFAGYRASEEGGGYDTLTVDVDQLYNQFNYGETSPRAIYEFMKFMVGEGDPKYLFIIGKGREVHSGFFRKTSIPSSEYRDLVPTAGTPGSDMLFSAGLSGQPNVPAVPTGRLTATNPTQVITYLYKVKEAEAATFSSLWRKKILHLSGGIFPDELVTYKAFMDGFATIAEGLYLGGEVITIGKHEPNPVEVIDVSTEVNAGLNFVTFFGHSSSTDTDIDIGKVTDPRLNYNNAGRYPAFLVNGCNAGEFFNNGVNFGEDWTLAPGRGARNFIASSSFGFDGLLRLYTEVFYEVAWADENFLNRGIGDVHQETAKRFLNIFSQPNSIHIAQAQQMILLGDPALKLFGATKPDYEVEDASLSVAAFDHQPIHALIDSLEAAVIVKNLGRAQGELLLVRLVQMLDDGTVYTMDKKFGDVLRQDTLRFTIKRGEWNFHGNYRVKILIDPQEDVEELNESNNEAQWSGFIPFKGTKNLVPQNFGIVSSRQARLVFQNTDLLAAPQHYLLELDTVDSFDSPYARKFDLDGGVLHSVAVDLLEKDSLVYYWRTRLKDRTTDPWERSSFAYINNGESGWVQMDGPQFSDNERIGLVSGAIPFSFDFQSSSVSIFIKTFGSTNANPSLNGSVQINNAEYYFSPQGFNCRTNTINLIAFNKTTMVPYRGVPFTYMNSGGRACGKEPQIINSFTAAETGTGHGDDLIQYVDNVGQSDSVVMFSMGDAGFASWLPVVKNKMEELGLRSTDFDALIPGEPVIILGRKGAAPGTAKIIRSTATDPTSQELQLADELTGKESQGTMTTGLIGPALTWKKVHQAFQSVEATDQMKIKIIGVTPTGEESILEDDSFDGEPLQWIDAVQYPYLRLEYTARDEVMLTPAGIKHWMVLFEQAPEGLVFLNQSKETVPYQEGAMWNSSFGFVNISTTAFSDSLKVNYQLVPQAGQVAEWRIIKIAAPLPGDSTLFELSDGTIGRVGLNDVEVMVNPRILQEQYFGNNSLRVPGLVEVFPDRTSPVLDVTFDGRYLEHGDWISPNPSIRISVKDENAFLSIADTTGLSILLQYPCTGDCDPTNIYFTNPEIRSVIYTEKGIDVVFEPKDLRDGSYTLFVQASDKSGNSSGEDYYSIEFNVNREPAITFYEVYPNPTSGNSFFEFKVAGAEPPERFLLQVFDSKGQLVSELTQDDLPPLRIGRNRVEWSSVDGAHRLMPAGMYYYRTQIAMGEEQFNHQGKILIVR